MYNESTSFDRYLYVLGWVIKTVKTNSKTSWTFFFVKFITPLYPDEKLNGEDKATVNGIIIF